MTDQQIPATVQDAKARAKAEKAYRKASRPWYRKKRWWLAGIVVLLVVIVAASSGGGSDKPTNDNGDVSKGLGTKDATGDIGTVTLLPADSIGVRYVEITVTNHSSKRSNYIVQFSLESPDGATRYDDGLVTVQNLEPGQSTTEKGIGATDGGDIPDTAVVKLKTVSRTAA